MECSCVSYTDGMMRQTRGMVLAADWRMKMKARLILELEGSAEGLSKLLMELKKDVGQELDYGVNVEDFTYVDGVYLTEKV